MMVREISVGGESVDDPGEYYAVEKMHRVAAAAAVVVVTDDDIVNDYYSQELSYKDVFWDSNYEIAVVTPLNKYYRLSYLLK